MRFLKIFLSSVFLLSLFSCGSDDDICVGGEATPRMKLKFKTKSTGKLKTLDSLYVQVNYGNGLIPVIAKSKVDSVFIPLRVDDGPFTEILVGLKKAEINSKIKVNYTTAAQYVSPACGIKKMYENVTSQLEVADAVIDLEQNQTQITDENKTHLFLLF
ncbi:MULTISPECIES: DUF6452 family protein [Chryseobacterium]|uniref:DUF6452 family protein n=1 Tax=Chryseobacterium sp. R2A-55 TaxID=2744445 RepID=UPI001F36D1B4|nr:DUF6452 family protein [Chryseobacterium sp. R2A-55]